MATHNGIVRAKHATLVGGTEDILNFTKESQAFEILNLGTTDIYARFDKQAAVAQADDTYLVRGKEAVHVPLDAPASQVRLISSGAAEYHVTRVQGA